MTYLCPVCMEEADKLLVNDRLEVVGCDNCVTSRDAEDIIESEEQKAERAYANFVAQYELEVRHGYA